MSTFQLDDVEIHYDIRGEGPPVVFISSLAAGGNIWDLVVPELAVDCRCLTFDNRGAGKSSAPRGPYTIAMLAKDAISLLGGLGFELESTVVVGQSMGGFVALELALQRRSAVGGLVLISTSPWGGAAPMGMSGRAREALSNPAGSREQIIRNIIDVSVSDSTRRRLPDNVDRFEAMLGESMASGSGFMGQSAAAFSFDVRDRLSEVRCPCRVIHGTADEWVHFSRGEALADAIPGASLVTLPGVGHFPQIEAPGEVVRVVRSLTK